MRFERFTTIAGFAALNALSCAGAGPNESGAAGAPSSGGNISQQNGGGGSGGMGQAGAAIGGSNGGDAAGSVSGGSGGSGGNTAIGGMPSIDVPEFIAEEDLPQMLSDAVCSNLGRCCEERSFPFDSDQCNQLVHAYGSPPVGTEMLTYLGDVAASCFGKVIAAVEACQDPWKPLASAAECFGNARYEGPNPVGEACTGLSPAHTAIWARLSVLLGFAWSMPGTQELHVEAR